MSQTYLTAKTPRQKELVRIFTALTSSSLQASTTKGYRLVNESKPSKEDAFILAHLKDETNKILETQGLEITAIKINTHQLNLQITPLEHL